MAELQIQIQGINELRMALRHYPKISEPILQRAIEATSAVFAKHTLKNDPVPWRTGNLLQSFRFTTARLQARWFPTAKYAPFVEYGTRPHMIFPRNAKVLAWQKGGGGKYVTGASGKRYYKSSKGIMVFAAHVRHPGTRAKPFMKKILQRSTPDVSKLFAQSLGIINRKIADQTKIL